jgi:hypothetical protein
LRRNMLNSSLTRTNGKRVSGRSYSVWLILPYPFMCPVKSLSYNLNTNNPFFVPFINNNFLEEVLYEE